MNCQTIVVKPLEKVFIQLSQVSSLPQPEEQQQPQQQQQQSPSQQSVEQPNNQLHKYDKISIKQKKQLIQDIVKNKLNVVEAANKNKIKINSAKFILQQYKKQNNKYRKIKLSKQQQNSQQIQSNDTFKQSQYQIFHSTSLSISEAVNNNNSEQQQLQQQNLLPKVSSTEQIENKNNELLNKNIDCVGNDDPENKKIQDSDQILQGSEDLINKFAQDKANLQTLINQLQQIAQKL